jgi:hypothetical protein
MPRGNSKNCPEMFGGEPHKMRTKEWTEKVPPPPLPGKKVMWKSYFCSNCGHVMGVFRDGVRQEDTP